MSKLKLTDSRDYFKPFQHPEFYDIWLKHEQSHWLHTEWQKISKIGKVN